MCTEAGSRPVWGHLSIAKIWCQYPCVIKQRWVATGWRSCGGRGCHWGFQVKQTDVWMHQPHSGFSWLRHKFLIPADLCLLFHNMPAGLWIVSKISCWINKKQLERELEVQLKQTRKKIHRKQEHTLVFFPWTSADSNDAVSCLSCELSQFF